MKQSRTAILIIITIVALIAGCASPRASSDKQVPLTISADRDQYSPIMSSTVGIGLTPGYPPSIDNGTASFRWQADYGHFVSWKAPDFKVNVLGPDVTTDDAKVYWSYSPDDMGKEKPPVHITLTMIDRASGRAFNSTGLEIGWKNRDDALVKA